MASPLPVLWLCGPPGVGKTAVGWELFTQLTAAGAAAGYVDIDQLGMYYPEPSDDPARHRMKTRNLAAVLASGLTVSEAARRVRESTGGRPGPASTPDGQVGPMTTPQDPAEGRVLWLSGPTGIGKSTIGFAVYMRLLSAGLPAAFVDLRQLGFLHPAPADDPGNHRAQARSLAGLWHTFHQAGAQTLVLVGAAQDAAAVAARTGAMPDATVTLCRLHADSEELTERILSRAGGGSWPEPGDPLAGLPVEHLRRVAEQAVADADRLEHAGIGTRVDTTGLTVAQAADLVLTTAGTSRRSAPSTQP